MFICPCNGGQTCIVDRRYLKDFVQEDMLFTRFNLPLRKHCFIPYTKQQNEILKKYIYDFLHLQK